MYKSKSATDFLSYFDKCFILNLRNFNKFGTKHLKLLKSYVMFSFRNAYLFNVEKLVVFLFGNSCLIHQIFEKRRFDVDQVPVKLDVGLPAKADGAIRVQVKSVRQFSNTHNLAGFVAADYSV